MAESPSRVRTTLRALRHRNFQLFFAGQLISLIGTWMQNVAQAWLVYRLTGSSALLGMVGFPSARAAVGVVARAVKAIRKARRGPDVKKARI